MQKNKKGFILIISYFVVVVLLILGSVYVARSVAEWRAAERDKDSLAAFYAADAGIDYALSWLGAQSNPPAGPVINVPAGPAIETGTYAITITCVSTANHIYKIISLGQSQNSQRELECMAQPESFARYAYFSNTEIFQERPVWFISSDTLNGPVHTNEQLHIANNPVFNDTVSSVADSIDYRNGGPPIDNPSFIPGQPKLGVNPIDMPFDATDLRTAAANGGMNLTGNTTVVLQSNGTMNVTNWAKGWNNKNMALPANGALFVTNGNLTVSGTLNGRLSAGTSDDIRIPDNITYNVDPRVNPNSTDMLGLVAEEDVVVLQTAPYNLTVQASIMAIDSSFYLENWASGLKGILTIYGGITQKVRGPVSTFWSSGSRASGYGKNYVYDPRLGQGMSPPYYPISKKYAILSWREIQ